MNGRAARRARREALRLIDAMDKFSDVLSRMMPEAGVDYGTCTRDQVDAVIAEACGEYVGCWEDLMGWVLSEGSIHDLP